MVLLVVVFVADDTDDFTVDFFEVAFFSELF